MVKSIQPLRIAVMMSGTAVNGVAVHCVMLIRYLVARGHKILLLHRPNAEIAQLPGLNGAELFATSFSRNARELIRVTRRINAFDPDVIHTHMSSAHTYGALTRLLSRRPVVATAHSTFLQLHWRLNNIVIATSPEAASYHRQFNRVPPKAMHMIPNFIDTTVFSVIRPKERHAARALLDLPQDAFVIGTVGDIGPRKSQIDLVRAFAVFVKARPNARLILAGGQERPYFDRLSKLASKLGVRSRIVATGSCDDVPQLLAAMDVFALSSRRETGPLAVLEAMSRGLPVLATDVGMVSKFLSDGVTGHVVSVSDTDAMARHMIALARYPMRRQTLGRRAGNAVRAKYDVGIIAPRIEAVLQKAAGLHNRPLLGFVAGLVRK